MKSLGKMLSSTPTEVLTMYLNLDNLFVVKPNGETKLNVALNTVNSVRNENNKIVINHTKESTIKMADTIMPDELILYIN